MILPSESSGYSQRGSRFSLTFAITDDKLRLTLQQKPQDEFVLDFVSAFRLADWSKVSHGEDWP